MQSRRAHVCTHARNADRRGHVALKLLDEMEKLLLGDRLIRDGVGRPGSTVLGFPSTEGRRAAAGGSPANADLVSSAADVRVEDTADESRELSRDRALA